MANFPEIDVPFPIPHKSIGAQDLLRDGYTHSGYLTKHFVGKRSIRNLFESSSYTCYVIVCKGCVYIFKNSDSSSPKGAFPLFGYNIVNRCVSDETQSSWKFQIVHAKKGYETYTFSAHSEKDMMDWMKKIRQEMMFANGKIHAPKKVRSSSLNQGTPTTGWCSIEEPIYPDPTELKNLIDSFSNLPKYTYSDEDLQDDDDDVNDYYNPDVVLDTPDAVRVKSASSLQYETKNGRPDRIKKRAACPLPGTSSIQKPFLPVKPLPSIPNGSIFTKLKLPDLPEKPRSATFPLTNTDVVKKLLPVCPPKPKICLTSDNVYLPMGRDVSTKDVLDGDIFYHGNKDDANRELTEIGEDGVYLVRQGGNAGWVLVVYYNKGPKKYVIERNERKKFHISKDDGFDSLIDLVNYYSANPLPTLGSLILKCPYTHAKP